MRFEVAGDVVCLGETMAVLVPAEPGPVRAARTWQRAIGGAESNVAVHLARLGVRSRWVGAVGDDAFGGAVLDAVGGAGVDVTAVRVDPDRPTGLYVKEADAAGSPVRYYRRGSAASALGPEVLDGLDLAGAALVHVTGITAALSDSCLALLRAVLARPRAALVSFDLNWRPALWRDRDPGVLRALLPGPATLVVKHGARGATAVEGGVPTFQEGLRVEVVEPVGAGDAFAAGYLAAHLAGEPPARRLRAGHLQAASALLTREDVGEPLPAEVTAPLLGADPRTWAAAHLRRRR